MQNWTLSEQVPVTHAVDVLVAGSGPAGFSAAICAARQGARVMLVEMLGTVGGISTSGMMSHFTGSVDSKFFVELLHRMAERNEEKAAGVRTAFIDTEKQKALYLDMLQEAGVTLRLYSMICDVMIEKGAICGVILQSKRGREAVRARVVIDATGDGDVAARAGVPFHLGRESDGQMQPVTVMFKVAGVDPARAVYPASFETLVDTERGELQALAKEILPFPAGHVLLYRSPLPEVVTCNMTNCIDVDGTNPEDLTRGESVCRGQIDAIVAFLREFVPGYEQCYLIGSSSLLGVRESRHFHGRYILTQEDILAKRQFEDWVVRGARFNFDVHNISGAGLDETGIQDKFPRDNHYTIPYRCLLPECPDGLLIAGRCMSGTHMAHSNYRVMPICVAMGEAAGIAAALAIQKNVPPASLDVRAIQALL